MIDLKRICFDIETASCVDLRKRGLDVYVNDPSTFIWCVAYAGYLRTAPHHPFHWHFGLWSPFIPPMDRKALVTQFCDSISNPTREHFPWTQFRACVADKSRSHTYHGWNVMFDAVVWNWLMSRYLVSQHQAGNFNFKLPLARLRDTQAQAQAMGLPGSLEHCGHALKLNITKDTEGRRLMMQMARPRRIEADGTVVWWDEPAKINRLGLYCLGDVASEISVQENTPDLTQDEQAAWMSTQRMNQRGILVDLKLATNARKVVQQRLSELNSDITAETGGAVTATTQVERLKKWVQHKLGDPSIEKLDKKAIAQILEREVQAPGTVPVAVIRALRARQEAARASTAKIDAMLNRVGPDGRLRWMFKHNGAGSTGRWSSVGVQVQNLFRARLDPFPAALEVVKTGDIDRVRMFFGDDVMTTIAKTIRSMLVAFPGNTFTVADWSSIEALITAALAGDLDKLKVFANKQDIYKHTGSRMFGVPEVLIEGDRRQASKVCELALGFAGGVGALSSMAENFGIGSDWNDEYKKFLVGRWRESNPRTVSLWDSLLNAAMTAVQNAGLSYSNCQIGSGLTLTYQVRGGHLWTNLPSGREICYPYVRIEQHPLPWDATQLQDTIIYEGLDPYTRKWGPRRAWRGILVENPVQAIAADLMREALRLMDEQGMFPVMIVHDEAVCEQRNDLSLRLRGIFETLPSWWPKTVPLHAEVWSGPVYRK